MDNKYNWKLIAKDSNYPRHGGMAALIGIYPSEEGAEYIRTIVSKKYPYSDFEVLKTSHSLTIKCPENFTPEKLKQKIKY